jgi:hypothetical protein
MLTRDGARLQVFLELRRRHGIRRGPEELVIVDDKVIERSWGWVFPYTTRGFLNGDMRYAIAGNGPIMINRHDGTMRACGTGMPTEHYVDEYESELERRQAAWELVVLEPGNCPTIIARGLRSALGLSILELDALKRRLPCVIQMGAYADLSSLLQRLIKAGVRAEIRATSSCNGEMSRLSPTDAYGDL